MGCRVKDFVCRVAGGADWVLHVTDRQQASHFQRLFLLGKEVFREKELVYGGHQDHPLIHLLQQPKQLQQQHQHQQRCQQVYMQHLGLGLVTDAKGRKFSSRKAAGGLAQLLHEALQRAGNAEWNRV